MFAQSLGVFVKPEQTSVVWHGVTSIFRDYGYRRLRSRARLKFLMKDWGAEKFREVLEKEYLGFALPDGPERPRRSPAATTSASARRRTGPSTSGSPRAWAG